LAAARSMIEPHAYRDLMAAANGEPPSSRHANAVAPLSVAA